MASHEFDSAFSSLIDSQLEDGLDDIVLDSLRKMDHPREAISTSKSLKEDGNLCFRKKDLKSAIARYGKSLQFLCVS